MTVKITKASEHKAEIALSTANTLGVQRRDNFTAIKAENRSEQDEALIQSDALEIEDEFNEMYFNNEDGIHRQIIAPPYNFAQLAVLVQRNNALNQNISAMEVNIDGTGHEIKPKGQNAEDNEESKDTAAGISSFFDEVYPKQSFITVRRACRRDQEILGNAYAEVLRTVSGRIAFIRRIEAQFVRLLRLDDAVKVDVQVDRFGEEITQQIFVRERRYVQMVNKKLVYFKEFGASRHLNKWTGEWETETAVVALGDRATELLHFTPFRDAKTPYGVPRWINNLPSVLGSRKAEEFNLDFFDAGGLPPALIMVQGGSLTEPVREALESFMSGKGGNKHRAAIVEAINTSGDLNSAGSVKVTVERFGGELKKDSMFEIYDSNCEARLRSSFRLPPLLVGKSNDYSFATSFASYTVAEAQVFAPERKEFDEIINNTIMKELAPKFIFRSLPMQIKDIEHQLQGLDMAKNALNAGSMVRAVNEITQLKLMPEEELKDLTMVDIEAEALSQARAGAGALGGRTVKPRNTPTIPTDQQPVVSTPVTKMDSVSLIDLSARWARFAMGDYDPAGVVPLIEQVKLLKGSDRDLFTAYVTMRLNKGMDHDPDGAMELMGGAIDMLCACEDEHASEE